jgi:hypothetical protein
MLHDLKVTKIPLFIPERCSKLYIKVRKQQTANSKTPLCNIVPQAGCDVIKRTGIQTEKQLFTYLHAGFHADVG